MFSTFTINFIIIFFFLWIPFKKDLFCYFVYFLRLTSFFHIYILFKKEKKSFFLSASLHLDLFWIAFSHNFIFPILFCLAKLLSIFFWLVILTFSLYILKLNIYYYCYYLISQVLLSKCLFLNVTFLSLFHSRRFMQNPHFRFPSLHPSHFLYIFNFLPKTALMDNTSSCLSSTLRPLRSPANISLKI